MTEPEQEPIVVPAEEFDKLTNDDAPDPEIKKISDLRWKVFEERYGAKRPRE